MPQSSYEYELIDISFGYELPEEEPSIVRDDGPQVDSAPEENTIKYDADGIPMGSSHDETLIRREMIHKYIQEWRAQHADNLCVYNEDIDEYIKVNHVFLLESVAHSAHLYKSTKAVLNMEEVMAKARKIGLVKAKEGTSNQKPFQQMIVMQYKSDELGSVKMTVGIRKRTLEKVQYSITVPELGTPLIDETSKTKAKSKSNKRKKHPRKDA